MRTGFYLFLISWLLAMGCDQEESEPAYPPEPFVEHGAVELIQDNTSGFDTLRLTFDFRDGDFDLGLRPEETDSPYHVADFFLEHNQSLERFAPKTVPAFSPFLIDLPASRRGKLATFGHLKRVMQNPPPLSCTGYIHERNVLVSASSQAIIDETYRIRDTLTGLMNSDVYALETDTFLVAHNNNFHNIFVDYLVEQPDGSFQAFDWINFSCQNFPDPLLTYNGRFPLLIGKWTTNTLKYGPFVIKRKSGQTGVFVYKMAIFHGGLNRLFGGRRFKLAFSIQDRALNRSNVAETAPISIPE